MSSHSQISFARILNSDAVAESQLLFELQTAALKSWFVSIPNLADSFQDLARADYVVNGAFNSIESSQARSNQFVYVAL